MKTRMSGINSGRVDFPSFKSIYDIQLEYQQKILGAKIGPHDSKEWFAYHMLAMQEELGELLKADKRWKTHRNTHFDLDNKLEELSDVFITLINLYIYSGVDSDKALHHVHKKLLNNLKNMEE